MAKAIWPTAPQQTTVHCILILLFFCLISLPTISEENFSRHGWYRKKCAQQLLPKKQRKNQQKKIDGYSWELKYFRVSKWKSRRQCICRFQWSDDEWLCIQVARPTKSQMEVTQRHTFPILLYFARTSRKTTKTMVQNRWIDYNTLKVVCLRWYVCLRILRFRIIRIIMKKKKKKKKKRK